MKKRFVSKIFIIASLLVVSTCFSFYLYAGMDNNPAFVTLNEGTIQKELEIPLFLNIWNHTKTKVGKTLLSYMTIFPITDKATLMQRQEIVKICVEHPELQTKMQEVLLHLSKTETMFACCLDANNPVLPQLDQQGPGNWISGSPLSLFAWFGFKLFRSNWNLFLFFGGGGLFAEAIRAKRLYSEDKLAEKTNTHVEHNHIATKNHEKTGFFSALKEAWGEFKNYKSYFSFKDAFSGSIGELIKKHSPWIITYGGKKIPSEYLVDHGYPRNIYEDLIQAFPFFGKHSILKVVPFLAAIGRVWWTDVALYNAFSSSAHNIKEQWVYIDILHKLCVCFRKFFDGLKELLKLQKEYNLYNSYFEKIKKILVDPEIKEIITLLYTDTFQEEKIGYLFHYGRVIFVYKKIRKNMEKFTPLLSFVAEYDAYLTIANAFVEQKNTDKPFCFVEFVDTHGGAFLDVKNAWIPLIPKDSIVQDIRLGDHVGYGQHMIITGPNLSGKSMYLKMTGLVAFLAQSWGIAPAESCKMTIFDYLETCLDPEGSVQEELSKFAKQKECVSVIQEHISHCTQGKKGLFLIDEIFNGTVDDIIALKTIEFGESVAENKNAIVQITTHLKDPTILEKSTHGLFKNFHVDIIPNPDGSFVRTFKVVPGISTWWFDITQKELRAKFTDWIDEQLAKKRKVNAKAIVNGKQQSAGKRSEYS